MENIFDGFEYCGTWYKNMRIIYANNEVDVDVQINGYDEDEMPENGKKALLSFLDDMDNTLMAVLEGIFEYYQERREELGYDEEEDDGEEEYPNYSDCNELLDTLQLIGITVPDQDDYSERAIFLAFNCDWDEENGVGVCLIGDTVDEVGEQGIAL